MSISKTLCWSAACLGVLLLSVRTDHAQEKNKSKIKQKADGEVFVGKLLSPGDPSDGAFKFLSYRYAFDRQVTGAPYAATAVTEKAYRSGNGQVITQRTESKIYRDDRGRTRREQALGSVGRWTAAGEVPGLTVINDPVAGFNYLLDPDKRSARKLSIPQDYRIREDGRRTEIFKGTPNLQAVRAALPNMSMDDNLLAVAVKLVQPDYPAVVKAAGVEGTVRFQVAVDDQGEFESITFLDGPIGLKEAALAAIRECRFAPRLQGGSRTNNQGIITFKFALGEANSAQTQTGGSIIKLKNFNLPVLGGGETKIESLGSKTMESLLVEGTRSITMIPAGKAGNREPIEIIYERWYSPELRILVMSKYQDPRLGTITYQLFGITRDNPEPSLFQVPGDYSLHDESRINRRFN